MIDTRMKTKSLHVIGIDYGTLSARLVLVDAMTGQEKAALVSKYADGVIDQTLPGSAKQLDLDTALQNPADYLAALDLIPKLLKSGKVKADQVLAIGIDFTSCTMLPVKADGTPLCLLPKWRDHPHAWVKLWKHHSAQPQADRINQVAASRQESWARSYGFKYSSEWFFSKLLETLEKDPAVYNAADRFAEAGDWLVWMLSGKENACISAAGFKGMRLTERENLPPKLPDPSYFAALHPKLKQVHQKICPSLVQLGAKAGGLTKEMASRTGLLEGTAIAAANIDAHAAVPACGVTSPGKLVMIMGTSTCHLMADAKRKIIPGVCGVVKDGVLPGFWGYEAGQAGVGDLFAWFAENAVPATFQVPRGVSVLDQLEAEAAKLGPGECGVLALDWWNGNRSLADANLSGVLLGLNLSTRPPHIYRALQEATAMGTRMILEAFQKSEIPINEVYACGGLARRSPGLLQIYADVLQRPIIVAAAPEASALGAAIFASLAGGIHPDLPAAVRAMCPPPCARYKPNLKTKPIYDLLFQEYKKLHHQFGVKTDSPLKVLKKLRLQAFQKRKGKYGR